MGRLLATAIGAIVGALTSGFLLVALAIRRLRRARRRRHDPHRSRE